MKDQLHILYTEVSGHLHGKYLDSPNYYRNIGKQKTIVCTGNRNRLVHFSSWSLY
jgi:hypothetical protein